MRITLWTLSLVAVILLSNLQAEGHHSFGATYNVDKQVTLKGTLVQIAFRSPHSFFFVEAKDANGTVQRWTIEGAAGTQFARQGVDKDAFKIGDPVEVIGNPSRTPNSPRAILIKITRTTDGKSWGGRIGESVD